MQEAWELQGALGKQGELSIRTTHLQLLGSGRSGWGPPCLSYRLPWDGFFRGSWIDPQHHSSQTPFFPTPPPLLSFGSQQT